MRNCHIKKITKIYEKFAFIKTIALTGLFLRKTKNDKLKLLDKKARKLVQVSSLILFQSTITQVKYCVLIVYWSPFFVCNNFFLWQCGKTYNRNCTCLWWWLVDPWKGGRVRFWNSSLNGIRGGGRDAKFLSHQKYGFSSCIMEDKKL